MAVLRLLRSPPLLGAFSLILFCVVLFFGIFCVFSHFSQF